jgi:fatty acid synthase subunit alpha
LLELNPFDTLFSISRAPIEAADPRPQHSPTVDLLARLFLNIMRPEVEQELAHTLLVELLAYQFASPVRWIETQDVILGEKMTERIVEVGPADTLGVMAKRTLASKYEAHDAARTVTRQILCYNKDAKDIYYDVDPVEEEPEPVETPASSGAPSGAALPAAASPAAAPPPSAGPAAQVPDEPITATDILRALVAQKLKKPLLDIPLAKAIKDLVGGKLAPRIVPFYHH